MWTIQEAYFEKCCMKMARSPWEICGQDQTIIISEPVLSYFDPNQSLILQCGASETDLGAAILQIDLAFASRALTDIETRYAQLENDLLAVVFGLEKFHKYTYGRDVTVQIDHKHWR